MNQIVLVKSLVVCLRVRWVGQDIAPPRGFLGGRARPAVHRRLLLLANMSVAGELLVVNHRRMLVGWMIVLARATQFLTFHLPRD